MAVAAISGFWRGEEMAKLFMAGVCVQHDTKENINEAAALLRAAKVTNFQIVED